MRKKVQLRDCDLVCVVTLPSEKVGNDVFSRYLHHVRTLDGLINVLLSDHISFRLMYFDPSDESIDSFVSCSDSFVYGLVFEHEFLSCRPCSSISLEQDDV